MPLAKPERDVLERLKTQWESTGTADEGLLRYYQGRQRLEQIGLTIPPSLRRFAVIANWPRVVVDTIVGRQRVRSLILPGEELANPQLQAIYDGSNLAAHLKMFNRDRCIYGRALLSVGSNESDPSLPLVRVESPREMTADRERRPSRTGATATAPEYRVVLGHGEGPASAYCGDYGGLTREGTPGTRSNGGCGTCALHGATCCNGEGLVQCAWCGRR